MASVIWGILAIFTVIVVGFILRRTGAIPVTSHVVLTQIIYWAATPALLFSVLSEADLSKILGKPLLVAALSSISSALVFLLIAKFTLAKNRGDLVLGTMASSLTNVAHVGIPVATFILESTDYVAAPMIFQLGFFTPMYFVLADLAGSGKKPSFKRVLLMVITNPMVIAAAIGVGVAAIGLPVPQLVARSTSMLGQAAPPLVLLAFGSALANTNTRGLGRVVPAVGLVGFIKLIVHPALAWAFATVLGLTGPVMIGVVIMASLPSAQNTVIAATRAQVGEAVARGAVLFTTLVSLPIIVVIMAILR